MGRNESQEPAWGVVAHLMIPDGRCAEAIDFYTRAFAADAAMEPIKADDGQRILHAHLNVNGGSFMLCDDFPEYSFGPGGPNDSVTLHLQVSDADAAWQRAIEAGALETMPLADQFWGDRYGKIVDPFGFHWSIAAPVDQSGEVKMSVGSAA